MKWVEGYSPGEHELEVELPKSLGGSTSLVEIGQYLLDDGDKGYYIGYNSELLFLFDAEKRFANADKCKEYVEKRLAMFAQELGRELNQA